MTTLIKEYCKESRVGVIRDNAYGSDFLKISEFVRIALQDFPHLSLSDIKIVHYAGIRYAKTFGIEFPAHRCPDDYVEISQLECTY